MEFKLPKLGNNNFSSSLKGVKKIYDFMNQSEYLENCSKYNLMTGDPVKFKSYKPSLKKMKKILKSNELYQYQPTNGNFKDKMIILKYLKEIGIKSDINNLIFTYSTTHAFNLIFSCIARPGDAIVIPEPNYGLFDFVPERYNLNILTIPLKEENNWLIDINELNNLILNYNKEKEKEGSKSKVAFFYNMNPHNPTGKVIGKKQKNIIEGLGNIAIKHNIYIIDDLIYRDLCYDSNNMPLALSSYKEYFDNTISLFGISKSYNLASIRSGFVVANEEICLKLQDKIFHTMDSISVLNIASITAAFDINNKNYYKKYFKKIKKIYMKKYYILKCLVKGIENIESTMTRKYCKRKIKKVLGTKETKIAIKGIDNIDFVDGLEIIESGYFALLNIKKIKKIDDCVLFHNLYYNANVKVICGGSIMWPYANMNVVRINFAVTDAELINSMYNLKKYLDKIQ